MKRRFLVIGLCLAGLVSTTGALAADDGVRSELQEMRRALEAQQQQIQDLREAVQRRDRTIDQMQQQLDREQAASEAANVETARQKKAVEEKPFSLTVGGFIEAAGLYRQRNENADIGSTYGNVPFDGSANAHLSEFRGSARQSRLSLLAEGAWDTAHLSGYYEADFLGAAPTANEVESNSWNLRSRQLWAQVALENGFSLLGGQAWSLLTTDRMGIAPRRELVPLTIDAQYVVGYHWARQWQARVTQRFGDTIWASFSLENPETVLSAVNAPANVLGFNTSANAQSPGSLFSLSNVPGANGVSTDLAPDLIAKVAVEPGWGHYELKLLGRFFRSSVGSSTQADETYYATGEGLGVAAILPVTEDVDVVLDALGGKGIGRYAAGVGPDVTLRPDGSIAPVDSVSAMAGIEAHPGDRWELYAYAGLEYYGRVDYVNDAGRGVGYGSDLNDDLNCGLAVASASHPPCPNQNRLLWQVQPGFWYRFYKGPAGTIQLGMSYSFTYRSTWAGLGGVAPLGNDNIVMSSFRYYLP